MSAEQTLFWKQSACAEIKLSLAYCSCVSTVRAAVVKKYAVPLCAVDNGETVAVLASYMVAGPVLESCKRCVGRGIGTLFRHRGKTQHDQSPFNIGNCAGTELGIAVI